jgi:Zn-dependent metalloprotease
LPPHPAPLRVAAILLLWAAPTRAARAPEAPGPGAIDRSDSRVDYADHRRQHQLEDGASWRRFRGRHGDWRALWNESTGSPHRAVGPAIALGTRGEVAADVDQALRRFVAGNPDLFGAPELETVYLQQVRGVWYARYRQTLRGVPVLFEDWEFRVGAGGRLMLFGADSHPLPASTVTRPLLAPAVVREAARLGLGFDPAVDRVEGADQLYLIPVRGPEGAGLRLVFDVRVHIAEPPATWVTLVDAADGQVLWRHDLVRHAISGNVSGQVHPLLPSDPLASRPFEFETVNVGNSVTVTTDTAGNYSANVTGSNKVISRLSGPYCIADRASGQNPSFSQTVSNPATVNIAWTPGNSLDSERDVFYHVNRVHDFAKSIDPAFIRDDYAMLCTVGITAGVCNSFWDGGGLNFYAAGGGCPDMATLPDLIYHEYGHSINDELYKQTGAPVGMLNGTLHEGMADVNAAFLTDDPIIGQGFFGPGTILRDIDNTARWPEDRSGDGHTTGLILSGAFWDLRQSIGLTLATQLSHFAKYGHPDDPDDGLAMSEYFLETLVADDDDADLGNGTPHFAAINAAFNAHGIGSAFFLGIAHTPLADQAGPGPFDVSATFDYTPNATHPFGALDLASPTLHYSINGAAFTARPMSASGPPGQFHAPIPPVSGAIVRYYVSVADVDGGVLTDPPGAPGYATHVFLAGPYSTAAAADFETDPGWTVGAAGDNATTGVWLRAEPIGTSLGGVQLQPELDHTADPGQLCFVTGNATAGLDIGTNDVDGGHTTLTTPVFSALGLTNAAIEYYRWYTNNGGGDPGTDFWRVDLSFDGGFNWVPIELTTVTDGSWRRVVFFVSDYGAPTATMKLRFIAEDIGPASLVEAAVDDFRLLSLATTTGVGDAVPAASFAPAAPNPFGSSTRLRFTVARRARARLAIYDVQGRTIRTLLDGWVEPGAREVSWDGRDSNGAAAADGLYFARLNLDGREVVRSLVRLR